MKTITTMHQKIAVRAYYAWLNGSTAGAEADWLHAEAIELVLTERRAGAARKAAETRKARSVPKVPPEMLVVTTRRPIRRMTAH